MAHQGVYTSARAPTPGRALLFLRVGCGSPDLDPGSRDDGDVRRLTLVRARGGARSLVRLRTLASSSIAAAGRGRQAAAVGDDTASCTLPSLAVVRRTSSPGPSDLPTR